MYTKLSIFILSIFTAYAIMRTPSGQTNITIMYENGTVLDADLIISDILSAHASKTESSLTVTSSWVWASVYILFCVAALVFVIYGAVQLVKSIDIYGTFFVLLTFGIFMGISNRFMRSWFV